MIYSLRETTPLTFVGLLHLTALPAWLALSRKDRAGFVESRLAPVLAGCPTVRIRWFDIEAFAAASSDILFAEFDDPQAWNSLVEQLRDTPMFALPYFRLDQLLVGIEDGFVHHEQDLATGVHR